MPVVIYIWYFNCSTKHSYLWSCNLFTLSTVLFVMWFVMWFNFSIHWAINTFNLMVLVC